MTRAEALQMAATAELDLVEVSPTADPPVCRIMDFGKFLFEQNKKAHSAKRKQKQIHIKEVKFRPVLWDSVCSGVLNIPAIYGRDGWVSLT